MKNEENHEPVMTREVLEYLHIDKNSKVVDATLGLGGHTIEILKKGAEVLGIDADLESLSIAEKLIQNACPGEYGNLPVKYNLVYGNFRNIDTIAPKHGFADVDGILADLGISSYQLSKPEYGMSFMSPESPLDMRIDKKGNSVKASDLLNLLDKTQLKNLFETTLDKNISSKLALKVIQRRTYNKFEKVSDFLEIMPGKSKRSLKNETLPFLALRIAVNTEIGNLVEFLPKAFNLLKKSGRLIVISFHSLEDREVKRFFNMMANEELGKVIIKNADIPSDEELEQNPRSKSAKLRVIEKI